MATPSGRYDPSADSSGRNILFLGVGIGIGFGIWTLLSIVVWELWLRDGTVGPSIESAYPRPSGLGAPPDPVPGQPDASGTQPRNGGDVMEARQDRGGKSESGPPAASSSVWNESAVQRLGKAPHEWISEDFKSGRSSAELVRMSVGPPALRWEVCKSGASEDQACTTRVAGYLVGLTSDQMSLRSKGEDAPQEVGWKLDGERLTLTFKGKSVRFRPGKKQEIVGTKK